MTQARVFFQQAGPSTWVTALIDKQGPLFVTIQEEASVHFIAIKRNGEQPQLAGMEPTLRAAKQMVREAAMATNSQGAWLLDPEVAVA